MSESIKIDFNYSDIINMTEEEKLNTLLKIAFSNHTLLMDHGKILFGNGEAGLCDTVRENRKGIKILTWIIFTAVSGFATALFWHISATVAALPK